MNPEKILEHIVALFGHVVWPAVALLIVFTLRKEIRKAARSISDRISSAKSVKLTTSGIELEDHLSALEAKTDSQNVLQDDLRKLLETLQSGDSSLAAGQDSEAKLHQLADEYMDVKTEDWLKKVNAKNELVRKMSLIIAANEMGRWELGKTNHDGIRAGLAGAIHFDPKPDDIEILVKLIKGTKKKHVSYKIVLALIRLVESGNLNKDQIPLTQYIIEAAEEVADKPLRKLITRVNAVIKHKFAV